MGKNLKDLVIHIVIHALVLSLWLITNWFTNAYLLPRFPLTGMELVSFQVVKIALHLAVLRYLYRLIFPPSSPPNFRWR